MKAGPIAETLPLAGPRFFRYNQTNPSRFGSTRLAGFHYKVSHERSSGQYR